MTDFEAQSCEPCRVGAPAATDEERKTFLAQHPDWHIAEHEGHPELRRTVTFPDFAEALAFTDKVGALAEAEGHHPALLTEWGRVTVRWWTHKIGGLHRNDLILAAKTDQISDS